MVSEKSSEVSEVQPENMWHTFRAAEKFMPAKFNELNDVQSLNIALVSTTFDTSNPDKSNEVKLWHPLNIE